MSDSNRAATPIASILRGLWRDLALAWRNVVRQRRRSALGLLSVAAGVTAFILAAGFIDWIYWAMREDTIGSRLGHIQIVRDGYFETGAADPFAYLLPENAAKRDQVARLPGVSAVAQRLSVSGLVSLGDTTMSFLGEGIEPAVEQPFERAVVITEGSKLSPDQPQGVIVGQGLARNLGMKVGDSLVLLANTQRGGINAVEVRVLGFFSTVTKAYDDAAVRMPIGVARQLVRASGAHAWVVMLDDTGRTDAMATQIRSLLAGERLEVVPWHQRADFYNKTVALFSKQVGVMKMIIALIIILSISNTLTMSVLERTSEIGTTMALGANRWTTLRRFVFEGLVIGVLGGAIGAVAGIALALIISAVGIPMPPPPGMARGFVGEMRLSVPLVLDALLLAVGTTLVASWYPAWKASRMVIVDALRHAR